MTTETADKHLKRIEMYLAGTDSGTQFFDACKIAEDALYEVKKLYRIVEQLQRDNKSMNKSLNEIAEKNIKEIFPLRNKL